MQLLILKMPFGQLHKDYSKLPWKTSFTFVNLLRTALTMTICNQHYHHYYTQFILYGCHNDPEKAVNAGTSQVYGSQQKRR